MWWAVGERGFCYSLNDKCPPMPLTWSNGKLAVPPARNTLRSLLLPHMMMCIRHSNNNIMQKCKLHTFRPYELQLFIAPVSRGLTRPNTSQCLSFKTRRSTVLNCIKSADCEAPIWKMFGVVLILALCMGSERPVKLWVVVLGHVKSVTNCCLWRWRH